MPEAEGSTPAPQTVAYGHAPRDRPRTVPGTPVVGERSDVELPNAARREEPEETGVDGIGKLAVRRLYQLGILELLDARLPVGNDLEGVGEFAGRVAPLDTLDRCARRPDPKTALISAICTTSILTTAHGVLLLVPTTAGGRVPLATRPPAEYPVVVSKLFRMSTRVGWVVVRLAVTSAIVSILAPGVMSDLRGYSEFRLCLAVVTVYGTATGGLLGAAYLLMDRHRVSMLAVVLLLLAALPLYGWFVGLSGIATTALHGHRASVVVNVVIAWLALPAVLILAVMVPVVALLRDSTRRAFYDSCGVGTPIT